MSIYLYSIPTLKSSPELLLPLSSHVQVLAPLGEVLVLPGRLRQQALQAQAGSSKKVGTDAAPNPTSPNAKP